MLFSNKENIKVGISIHADNINYVVAREKRKKITFLDQGEIISKNIPLALKKINKIIKHYPCSLALTYRDFIVKTFNVSSSIRDRELHQLLTLNADDYFSYPLDKLNYDYEYIKSPKTKIRILAGKKEFVKQWQNNFANAGISLNIVTADILALENFIPTWKLSIEKNYALFLLHHDELLQMVLNHNVAIFFNATQLPKIDQSVLRQEIVKFSRLYESCKVYKGVIDHAILLIPENLKNNLMLPFPSYEIEVDSPMIEFNYLLAFGLLVPC